MQFSPFLKSKSFHWTVSIIAVLIILLGVFQLGAYVGFRKARFSYRWAENYHRMFGGPRGGFLRDAQREFSGRDLVASGHGVAGAVLSVAGDTFAVRGFDDMERSVRVTGGTVIRRGRETIEPSDIRAGDRVVVMGSPSDDGAIEAKMVRVFSDATGAPSRFEFPWSPRK